MTNSGTPNQESGGDGDFGVDAENPEIRAGLQQRIRECAGRVGSGDELAARSGIKRRTLERYLSGDSEPKATALAAIARVAEVSLDWLVLGRGPPAAGLAEESARYAAAPGAVDEELLATVIEAVEEHLAERGIALAPAKKALLLSQLYLLILEEEGTARTTDKDLVARLVRLAS